MLGISVYLKDFQEEYVERCAKHGVSHIFTSFQIPEDDYTDVDQKIARILSVVEKYHMALIPDVSKQTLAYLHLEQIQDLAKIGIRQIRLDYGFSIEEMVELQKDFILYLNASTLDQTSLDSRLDRKKLVFMHNYYPRNHTGLAVSRFIQIQTKLKQENVLTQAFICGDDQYRFPMYQGLPTLEIHRGINSYCAYLSMVLEYQVDDVFVGDSFILESSLQMIQRFEKEQVITLPAILLGEYAELYDQVISLRRDQGEDLIRLIQPRKATDQHHAVERIKGAIVMDNDLAGRYHGEISICKKDLPMDEGCNVIGYVHPEYLRILPLVKTPYSICFTRL